MSPTASPRLNRPPLVTMVIKALVTNSIVSNSMKARLDRLTRPWMPQGLYLRRDDRVVGGVCSAIGRWLGVDPTIVRLITVLLALANGLGVVLYVLA